MLVAVELISGLVMVQGICLAPADQLIGREIFGAGVGCDQIRAGILCKSGDAAASGGAVGQPFGFHHLGLCPAGAIPGIVVLICNVKVCLFIVSPIGQQSGERTDGLIRDADDFADVHYRAGERGRKGDDQRTDPEIFRLMFQYPAGNRAETVQSRPVRNMDRAE